MLSIFPSLLSLTKLNQMLLPAAILDCSQLEVISALSGTENVQL